MTSPLLCRYAYHIVCEWSAGEEAEKDPEGCEGAPVKRALDAYIKWEFHDASLGNGQSIGGERGSAKDSFEDYRKRAFSFLSGIAGKMGTADTVDKSEWAELRDIKGISNNMSFCILQECGADQSGKEQMTFIHRLFKDYFLTSYCVKLVKDNLWRNQILKEKDFKQLESLMATSSQMPSMYIEQMMESEDPLIERVLNYLRHKMKGNSAQLAKLAGGRLSLMYTSDAPFSIEEYLMVFPLGSVKYCGIFLDDGTFRELRATGILEMENANGIGECKISNISENIVIIGVKCGAGLETEFKYVIRDFKMICGGMRNHIDGYCTLITSVKELQEILSSSALQSKLSEIDVAADPDRADELLREAVKIRKRKNAERLEEENGVLNRWTDSIAAFMGERKNFWCLFDRGTLHMLEIIPENEARMADLFFKGVLKKPADYISFYGKYRAKTNPMDILCQEGRFREIADIDFKFDAAAASPIQLYNYYCDYRNAVEIYYDIYWKNIQLLRVACEKNRIFNLDDVNRMMDIQEVEELYETVDMELELTPNEKLALYISDEKLLTLYVAGQGDEMVALAEKTRELCEKYQHTQGSILREWLLSDDLHFKGEDLKRLYNFAKEHVWL